MQQKNIGISSIGVAIPQYGLPLVEFAKLRGVNAEQYTENLGCNIMSLCAPDENVISLAVKAAKRALQNWRGSTEQIGLVIVATESALDMSRPLSAWVMQDLNLKGNIRSYEVKHACYAGTVAVRQAVEWILSGNARGKSALLIAADVALYAPGHTGEPTQGAGAVALVIDQASIAAIDVNSFYWSESQFDFWRPVGHEYPEVNGRLSLTSYINAVMQCFTQLAPQESLANYLAEYELICMHVPFPKMVQKAFKRLGEYCGWDIAKINEQYQSKIYQTMEWNKLIGNAYTASLWFSVANALTHLEAKQQLLAFSYGSGCGAELLQVQCIANQKNSVWQHELEQDLSDRTIIDATFYQKLRDNK